MARYSNAYALWRKSAREQHRPEAAAFIDQMSKLLLAQQFGVGKVPVSNILGEHMHHRLMDVFDDSVIMRVDMKIDVRDLRRSAALDLTPLRGGALAVRVLPQERRDGRPRSACRPPARRIA